MMYDCPHCGRIAVVSPELHFARNHTEEWRRWKEEHKAMDGETP